MIIQTIFPNIGISDSIDMDLIETREMVIETGFRSLEKNSYLYHVELYKLRHQGFWMRGYTTHNTFMASSFCKLITEYYQRNGFYLRKFECCVGIV